MASSRTGAGRATTARRFTRIIALATLSVAVAGGLAAGTASAQEPPSASVRVVHGLRGLVADIYLDGALALPTFQPERSTDPLNIPAGDHVVEIRTAGAAASDTPLLTQTVTVPAGFQGSLVAHLDATGAPTLSAFPDDLSAVAAGQSRVTVRHAAQAEPVSVLVNNVATATPVAPKTEATQLLGAGTYELAVAPAAGGSVLAAPQSVQYADGTANFMYLIGSQSQGTLGWAVVKVEGLQSAPAAIQTGDGSTSSGAGSTDAPVALLVAVGVIAAGGLALRVRRASSPTG